MVEQGLTASTIQVRLSALRAFCSWVGKPGMVGNAKKYVSDPERVKRTYAAESDMSWTSRGVDIQQVLNAVAELDPYVGRQLKAQFLFGMRVKESVCFQATNRDRGTSVVRGRPEA